MTPDRPFAPVGRATLSERVRDEIHRRIASGELGPGSRLPSERLLAEQFGVARSSVREAVQGLVALGLIERRGNRSFVVERVPGDDVSPPYGRKSLREILEARQVLESVLFELSASRASQRERNEALALARTAPSTLEEFMITDREFHAAIAHACGNPVLVEVYGRVLDALVADGDAAALILGIEPEEDPGDAIRQATYEHGRIAAAFADRDVPTMLEEVDLHLGPATWRVGRLGHARVHAPGQAAPTRTVGM